MGLTRFWFEFDLTHPALGPDGFDDGAAMQDVLSSGAAVTAWDEGDALGLLRDLVGAALPPVARRLTDLDADRASLAIADRSAIGNPSWRGVWFPVAPAPEPGD